MKSPTYIAVGLAALLAAACSEASFHGGAGKRAQQSDKPTSTNPETSPETTTSTGTGTSTGTTVDPPPPPPPPPPPTCTDETQILGAQITFMIDNSSSNAATDCPFATRFGSSTSGHPLYECGLATGREKAVLASFDVLKGIAGTSSVSVVSFPTSATTGHQRQTDGWIDVSDGSRSDLAQALRFTRRPFGQTPYGEGLAGASEFFSEAASDQRARVALLITDGEPTDQHPSAVAAKADELRAAGVRVIAVFVTSGAARAQRAAKHREMLQGFETAWQRDYHRPWYEPGAYASFDAYFDQILGLSKRIAGADVIEVGTADQLEKTLSEITKKVVTCPAQSAESITSMMTP